MHENMEKKLSQIRSAALSLILGVKSATELEEIKLQFLGRSGIFTIAVKEIVKLPKENRPEAGKIANEVKQTIEQAINQTLVNFKSQNKNRKKINLDVTEPSIKPPLGSLHLVTQAIEEITSIFQSIGYTKERYPEVEWDWYAFEALNFPKIHPARDDWETFFIREKPDLKYGQMLLTPHTSSGQIRQMEKWKPDIDPPIRMLNIAKTYRRQSDVSHVAMFHQFEGLVVGEKIAITHLKGTLDFFMKSYFGPKRVSRIRPYHFQFTEPSFEVDVSCGACNAKARLPDGQGCRLCKEGWLELGGAGMVHPNVLKFCGINPKLYSGFAFGWGIERVLMMKEGINIEDVRQLYSLDLRFLQQF